MDGGIQEIVLTGPPSWSTPTRSGGRPPPAAACCSRLGTDRRLAAEAKFQLWMITPPIWPRRARASREADGGFPSLVTTSFLPTSCSSGGLGGASPGAGAAAGRRQ